MLSSKERARDNVRRMRASRARTSAAANSRFDPAWSAAFDRLQRALLRDKPHLGEHKHCGYAPDSEDRPRRRVKCPNGVTLFTTWYKVPTTDTDSRTALAEANWLIAQQLLQRKGLPNAYPFPLVQDFTNA